MKRNILTKLFITCLMLSLLTGLWQISFVNAKAETAYSVMIIDEADLLTPEEEQELWDDMTPLTEYGNAIFYTCTLDQGVNFEKNNEDLYYSLFGQEPGVSFQIDMGNRKLTLSSSTAVDNMISSERDSIVDNVYTYASDGNYLACAKECFEEVYTVINDGTIAHNMKYIDNAILALIISLVLNFIIVFVTSHKKRSEGILKASIATATTIAGATIVKGLLTERYDPISSGSGGSSGGGGGGGGGGFSGGSSSHGF